MTTPDSTLTRTNETDRAVAPACNCSNGNDNAAQAPSDEDASSPTPGGSPASAPQNYGRSDEPATPDDDDGTNSPSALTESPRQPTHPERHEAAANATSVRINPRDSNGGVQNSINDQRVGAFPSACSCGGGAAPQLVYALGDLWYDFGTEARRDSLSQSAAAWAIEQGATGSEYPVEDPVALLDYLDANPWDSSAVIWTLNDETTPIYALQADGPYAAEVHARIRAIFRAQVQPGGAEEAAETAKGKKQTSVSPEEDIRPIERVSIPGVIAGRVRLFTGQEVEVISPERRGIFAWNTEQLVESACRAIDKDDDTVKEELRAFLDRIYYELRNMGQTPQERAMNFAGTNAFNLSRVFSKAADNRLFLDTIEVETSPICRPDSECWDVRLVFFNPEDQFNTARRVFRFTVDVSDIVPVLVGRIRDWSIR